MEQEKCLDCGWVMPADMPQCPNCGKKMANDRHGDRRVLADRREGDDDYDGPDRRHEQRRKVSDRREFAY